MLFLVDCIPHCRLMLDLFFKIGAYSLNNVDCICMLLMHRDFPL